MAFSYDPDGGIAVARILSDHPEDNGKLVYLHRNYEPAIDDAWYDGHDTLPAALPPWHPGNQNSNSNANSGLDTKHSSPGEVKQSRRQRPQMAASSVGSAPVTSFSTAETPDSEFPFPPATPAGAAGPGGRSVLRGGAFGDEADEKAPPAAPLPGAESAGPDTAAQLGALSGAGAGANAAVPSARGAKRKARPGIQFDPLPAKDAEGNAVEPRRRQRQKAREETKDYGYPVPDKDPDSMTDAEFDAWADSLTDDQWDAFCDHMEDLEADSDAEEGDDSESEDEKDGERRAKRPRMSGPMGLEAAKGWKDMAPAAPANARPPAPPPKPIPTNPNPRSANGSTPMELLGADYFQSGRANKVCSCVGAHVALVRARKGLHTHTCFRTHPLCGRRAFAKRSSR